MSFSVEAWKKSFQRRLVEEQEEEQQQGEDVGAGVGVSSRRSQLLELRLSQKMVEVMVLQKKVDALEARIEGMLREIDELKLGKARMMDLESQVQALRVELELRKRDLEAIEKENRGKSEQVALRLAEVAALQRQAELLEAKFMSKLEELGKRSNAKEVRIQELASYVQDKQMEWSEREKAIGDELEKATLLLKEKTADLAAKVVESRIDSERCRAMEMALKEKIEELRRCKETCAKRYEADDEEMKLLQKNCEAKESELSFLRSEAQLLAREKTTVENTMKELQAENLKLSEELQHCQIENQRLRASFVPFEPDIATSNSLRFSLELKADLGGCISEQLERANARAKELEIKLTEALAFAVENDERLDASEWTVKHLGLVEVSNAKASLARAEASELQLQQENSQLQRELGILKEAFGAAQRETAHLKMDLERKEAECTGLRRALVTIQDSKQGDEHDSARLEQVSNSDSVTLHRTSGKMKQVHRALYESQSSTKRLLQQMVSLRDKLIDVGTGQEGTLVNVATPQLNIGDDSPKVASVKRSRGADPEGCLQLPTDGTPSEVLKRQRHGP